LWSFYTHKSAPHVFVIRQKQEKTPETARVNDPGKVRQGSGRQSATRRRSAGEGSGRGNRAITIAAIGYHDSTIMITR
jgi:hypothetical protein